MTRSGRWRNLARAAALLAAAGAAAQPAPAQTSAAEPAVAPAAAPAPAAEPRPTPGVHPTAARLAETEQGEAVRQQDADRASGADLWQRIRKGFVLDELRSPLVAEQESWYASRPDYIQRFVDRGARYLYHVVEEVEKRGMPTEIALLPIIESAFNPQAYSRAKAAGMWQFIPSTGKNFGLKQDWFADNRRDVLLSTGAAMDYLQKLYGMFNSWELALAAYNCGEGCVSRAIQKNLRKGLPTDYLSLNLPNETRGYVPKLIAVKNIILSPGDYGIDLVPVENRPYFVQVAAPERMDLKLAARLAEMPEEEFAALNPASHRPVAATATGAFLVPTDKADTFRENLELYRSLQGPFVSWQMVQAKRGESLEAIAKRHGMTASYLRATSGPFKEKKGKLTQAASFMVPNAREAKIIDATLEKKIALKAERAERPAGTETSADGAAAVAVAATNNAARAEAAPANATSAIAITANATPSATTIIANDMPTTTHVVSRGETLFSLSRLYNTSVEDIRERNNLSQANLRAGQKLIVVGSAPLRDTALIPAVDTRPSSSRSGGGSERTHTIRNGDTLYAISLKYGVALADLMRWNRLTPRSVIRPGAKIKVGV